MRTAAWEAASRIALRDCSKAAVGKRQYIRFQWRRARVWGSKQGLLASTPVNQEIEFFANPFVCLSILIKILQSCRNNLADARVYLTHQKEDHYWCPVFMLESNSQSLFPASLYLRHPSNRPWVRWIAGSDSSVTSILHIWGEDGERRRRRWS